MIKYFTFILIVFSSILVGNEFDPTNGDLPAELSLSNVHFVGARKSHVNKADGWLYHSQKKGLRKQWEKHGVRAFSIALQYYDRFLKSIQIYS